MSENVRAVRRNALRRAVFAEVERAYAKHGSEQWGRHEFYGIAKEEFEEMWDAIKADEPQERVYAEMTQLVAMCFRYFETGDRYRNPEPTP